MQRQRARATQEGLIVSVNIDSAQRTSHTDVPAPSIPPRNSLFHTIAMLLGVDPAPKAPVTVRGGDSYVRPKSYETPVDILARRHPYLYIRSLSG